MEELHSLTKGFPGLILIDRNENCFDTDSSNTERFDFAAAIINGSHFSLNCHHCNHYSLSAKSITNFNYFPNDGIGINKMAINKTLEINRLLIVSSIPLIAMFLFLILTSSAG